MARKIPVLGRMLGAPALFAIAYGEIGSSLYFALGLTSVYALSATPFVFLAAGLLFALAAAAYAEGGATIAEPGGAASFARRAFNDLVGFIAGWAAALDYVIAIALSALFVPRYLTGAFGHPNALSDRQAAMAAVGVLAAITLLRLVRRTNAYLAGIVLAILDLVVQISLAVLGLVLLFNYQRLTNNIDIGVAPTWNSLAFSLPVAMVAYTGLEKVSSLTGLAKDPGRTVPASIRTSAFTVVVIYAAVATAAVSAFPSHPDPSAPAGYSSQLSTTWVNAPILGLVHAIGRHTSWWIEDILRVGVGLTAVAILMLAITTSISGFARMAESMGRHVQVPAVFARRSRRVLAAPAAIGAIGLLSAGFIVVASFFEGEETLVLASLYSFGILLAFTITQASIIWLRITEPDMPRAFMMHGNVRIAGRLIPLTSVAGALLSFAAWVLALGTHPGCADRGAAVDDRRAADVHRRACPGGSSTAGHRGSGCTAAGLGHRAAAGRRGRAAGTARPDRGGDDGHRLSARTGCGLGGGGGERDRGSGARSAGLPPAGARAGGGRGTGRGRVAGRRVRRLLHRRLRPHPQPWADGGGRGHRAQRCADRGGRAVQTAARPHQAGGVLRTHRRLHPAQGAVPRDRHALPRLRPGADGGGGRGG